MDEAEGERPRTKVDAGIGTLLAGNGVRGVGMLLVFFTHLFLLADVAPDNNMRSYGWAAPILGHIDLGLAAFFALSGYLIARPFARWYVIGTRKPGLRSYVRNRVLRVVPAFYLFTVLVLLRFGVDGTLESGVDNTSSALQIVGQFLFVQGQTGGPAVVPIGPAWSIGAEVGFYVAIPLAAWMLVRVASRLQGPERRAVLGVAFVGAVMLVSIASRNVDQYRFAWLTSPPAIMYVFMPGVAIALVEPLLAARLRDRARPARLIAYGAFAARGAARGRLRGHRLRPAPDADPPRARPARAVRGAVLRRCSSSGSSSCSSARAARRACSPTASCSGWASARTRSTSRTSGCSTRSTTRSATGESVADPRAAHDRDRAAGDDGGRRAVLPLRRAAVPRAQAQGRRRAATAPAAPARRPTRTRSRLAAGA